MKVKVGLLAFMILVMLKLSYAIEINYKPSTFEIFNDGHAIRIKPTEETSKQNTIVYKNTKYLLKDVHIVIWNDRAPEIHFLHISANPLGRRDKVDDVLVIAVKLSPEGKVNETLEKIIKNLHEEIGIKEKVDKLNVGNLLPNKIVPFEKTQRDIKIPIPSSEALWLILQNPLLVSPKQYEKLKSLKLERFSNSPIIEEN
ncbi:MAG: hypothetical protein DSY59_05795 [Persephonella sp.]|nr:MAG: hypothetical protein DSY59_05795 [Persephonella sp.]